MRFINNIYKWLPVWLQNILVSSYGLYWYWLRYGPGYSSYVKEYQERGKFSAEEWQNWQKKRLQIVLNLAVKHVPYYQQMWTKSEKTAAMMGDLRGLPILDKAPIRRDPKMFLRQDINPRPRIKFHTSGTSGTPIVSIWTVQEVRNSHAFHEVRGSQRAGVSFKLPRATFSGRMVEPNPESKGPYYRFNKVENQVYFSAFHLRADTAHQYVNALHKHNIQWLTGYAVSYYLLAKFILEQNLQVPSLKAIVTTSEKVTTEMRQTIERAFGCRVFVEYNNVENTFFANECDHARLHVSPDVGVLEILCSDGSPCEPGEVGEVVATSLFRTYQPFIRYRLGDLAAWDPDECSCGSPMPVIREVVGRIEDVVIGPDGRQMVRFHGIFADQPHIKQGQIIQEALNCIRVKVVPTAGFVPEDVADIVKRVQARLGPTVQVIVESVEQIPLASSGKFKAVVSLLSDKNALKASQKGGFEIV